MVNFSKVKKEVVTKFMLLAVFIALTMPIVSGKLISKNYATSNTTTTESGGLGDIDVSMGDDGTVSVTGFEDGGSESTWNKIFQKYKVVIAGISGVCTLTFIVIFMVNISKLGMSADNPTARSKAIGGLLVTGIAVALFGSVTVICGLFWNSLK